LSIANRKDLHAIVNDESTTFTKLGDQNGGSPGLMLSCVGLHPVAKTADHAVAVAHKLPAVVPFERIDDLALPKRWTELGRAGHKGLAKPPFRRCAPRDLGGDANQTPPAFVFFCLK
jgi:hypothetical protein